MERSLEKRVLLLTPKLTGRDGISLVSRLSAAALVEAGWQVDVLTLGDPGTSAARSPGLDEKEVAGIPAGASLQTADESKLRFARFLAREALRSEPRHGLVLVQHVHLAPTALPLARRGARLALFMHGIEVWKPLRPLQHAAVRAAAVVMANSSYTVEQFKLINPTHAGLQVRVCPLGISEAAHDAQGPPLVPGRYALIVGRMVSESRYKGHGLLLELWRQVIQYYPDFMLVIAGDGPERPGFQEKARGLGLLGNVLFTGLVSDEQLSCLYRDCEFFILPSVAEGFGLVYLEAMRAGKACIAGVGAPSGVIIDGVTGLLVHPEQPEEVLNAILGMACRPERTRQMGAAGRARFLQNFTAAKFGEYLLRALFPASEVENVPPGAPASVPPGGPEFHSAKLEARSCAG